MTDTIAQLSKRITDLENIIGKDQKLKVTTLPANASPSDIINKINELILLINKRLR